MEAQTEAVCAASVGQARDGSLAQASAMRRAEDEMRRVTKAVVR